MDNFFKKQEIKESGKNEVVEVVSVENAEHLSTKRRSSIGSPITKSTTTMTMSRPESFNNNSATVNSSLPSTTTTNEKTIKRETSTEKKSISVSTKPQTNASHPLFGYPSKISFSVQSLILPCGVKKGDLIYFTWKVDETNSGVSSYYPVTDLAKIHWSTPELLKIKVLTMGNIEKKYIQKKTLHILFKQAIELEKGEKTTCDPIFGEFVVNLSQYISMHKGNAYLESKAKVKENSNPKTQLKFTIQSRRIIEGYALDGLDIHPEFIECKSPEEDKKESKEFKSRVKDLRRVTSAPNDQDEKSQSRVSFSASQAEAELKTQEVVFNDKKLSQLEEKYKTLEMKYNSVVEQCHTANRLYEELYSSTQQQKNSSGSLSNLGLFFDETVLMQVSSPKAKSEAREGISEEKHQELLNTINELEEKNISLQLSNHELQLTGEQMKEENDQLRTELSAGEQMKEENAKLRTELSVYAEEMKELEQQNKELQRRVELLSIQCSLMASNTFGSSLLERPPLLGETEIDVQRYQFQHLKNYFKKLEDKTLPSSNPK